jgi:hypothetical protein
MMEAVELAQPGEARVAAMSRADLPGVLEHLHPDVELRGSGLAAVRTHPARPCRIHRGAPDHGFARCYAFVTPSAGDESITARDFPDNILGQMLDRSGDVSTPHRSKVAITTSSGVVDASILV